ncbi:type II secretion system protein GspC [Shewanella fidelis]|uniref:Type II secretion system protein GspC n=1 Tax=Shewanella fidelis TaxID=173509 RepID=A0AAW8NT43_9GAMM|nr:type II secretion system protein GspC [Shewanella fidelis]MDR8525991.1 type II secretion system protein GspC [Shewanella fidelis]MDW4813821.1 type II secretion system protein GspC [Shewanella fidelis]MDW4817987.1 type II secretion system protein GspC [Shewanella fidelis]MDW4822054.1 type II secretion system protein GspC [Shewanella fidelis]MDW4826219.1 type II secretion system protein GspC [Shewanella fidelis]
MDLLDKFLTKAAGVPQKPVSTAVFSLGVLIALYLLAQMTWKLIPNDSATTRWVPTPVSTSAPGQVNILGLQQLSLFGKVDAEGAKPKAAPVEEIITDAPKTSLSIQLTGVVASTTEKKGLAVIASSGSQDTYSLGDKIKGTSASLKEVYADRIIITNSGRYETLMLDGLEYSTNGAANQQLQQAKSVSKGKTIDNRSNRAVAAELSQSREEILADPSKITDYLSISPVKSGGELAGYRLNPGKDRELFKQAGFKANDLAKSINGYDLTDMGQALEVMAQLPDMTEVALMVEREGQLIEIMFSLPE